MFAKKRAVALLTVFVAVLMAVLLGGCGINIAFSPEAAVAKEVAQPHMPDFQTDPNSVRVLQKQEFGKKYMVLVSFQGVRANAGRENCMFSYEVIKSPIGGWMTGGGGGGCSNQVTDPEAQPIGIGGGGGSGGTAGDPGYSQVYGEVFNAKVKTVQVTWSDGSVNKVEPANNVYYITRVGQVTWSKVEALDEQGMIFYSFEPNKAPGKQ